MAYHSPTPPIINGLRGSFKQPGCRYGRNDSGFFWEYIYEGTAAEVAADAEICRQNGLIYTVENLSGGRARLTYKTGGSSGGDGDPEVPEDIWELESQDIQKDLLEADFPDAAADSIGLYLGVPSKDNRLLIRKAVDQKITKDDIENGFFDEADDPGAPGSGARQCISWFMLMNAGVKYFPVDASVIRHSRIVSNEWTVKASFSNVGRILSSSSLISLENAPSAMLFDVPVAPAVSQYIETPGDLQYGWRKQRPQVTRLNSLKWRIGQSYQFGLWSIKIFGNVI